MPPRLTYWTGLWEPRREALSKEIAFLRGRLAPHAPVVSFSAGQRSFWLPQSGVIRLSARRYAALRTLAAVLEPLGAFSHVAGALDAWHLLRVLGRRPVLFTAAIDGPALDASLLGKVTRFAAESETLADALVRSGVPAARIELAYPGVDLDHFRPRPRSAERFRVLFASSPASPADFERRGIPLMVDAARRVPDAEIVLLWRRWGNLAGCLRALAALEPPANLRVDARDVDDMAAVFATVHATLFLPTAGHGKACPNSVIEGLAAGCPTVTSGHCGIASLIEGSGAGVVLKHATAAGVAGAIEDLRRDFAARARAARDLAECRFSAAMFAARYGELYSAMAAPALRAHAFRARA